MGRSLFDEAPEDIGVNDEALARSRAWLTAATWRFTPAARLAILQRVYVTGMDFKNVNKNDILLDRGEASDLGWRADVTFAPSDGLIAEFGGDVLRSTAARRRQRTFDGATEPVSLSHYSASGRAASAYAQVSARIGRAHPHSWRSRRLLASHRHDHVVALDHRRVGDHEARRNCAAVRVSIGSSPTLTMLNGLNGNPDLRPERATHADLGIVQTFHNSVSLQVTAFRRDERDVLRIADSEPRRLADGTTVLGRGDAPWSNRLTGRAHGSRGHPQARRARCTVRLDRLRLRTTSVRRCGEGREVLERLRPASHVSAYALYRLSNRSSLGVKFRYGSNYPITGYVGGSRSRRMLRRCLAVSGRCSSGSPIVRNTLRLPAYHASTCAPTARSRGRAAASRCSSKSPTC